MTFRKIFVLRACLIGATKRLSIESTTFQSFCFWRTTPNCFFGGIMTTNSLLLGSAFAALLSSSAWAADLVIDPIVDAVTIYPSGATVSELAEVSLPEGLSTLVIENFPQFVDASTLRATGNFTGTVTVLSINSRETDEELSTPQIDELQEQRDTLQDQKGVLGDELRSAQARLKLVEDFARQAPRGFTEALAEGADALAEWQTALDAIQSGQTTALGDIRRLHKRIADLNERTGELQDQIAELQQDLSPLNVLVNVSSEGAAEGILQINYQTSLASWSAGYDALLDTNEGKNAKLDLVQLASVTQHTEQDWNDIQLILSTTQPARGTSAPSLSTLQVFEPVSRGLDTNINADQERLRGGIDDRFSDAPAAVPSRSQMKLDVAGNVLVQSRVLSEQVNQRTADTDVGRFKASFVIPGRVSISGDGAEQRLTLARHSVSPELLGVAVPSVQPVAFLHAQIKNDTGSALLGGNLSAYRDGTFMGRTWFNAMAVGDERSLGFGPDDKVSVTYVTEDRQVAQQGIISSERTDTRRYVTKVTNNHDEAIRVRIVDRQPFSEDETIRVERLSSSTAPSEENVKDQRGILAWSFEYAPAETRDIRFDYRVTWPAEKNIRFSSQALR